MLGTGRCGLSYTSGLALDSTKNMTAESSPITVACEGSRVIVLAQQKKCKPVVCTTLRVKPGVQHDQAHRCRLHAAWRCLPEKPPHRFRVGHSS